MDEQPAIKGRVAIIGASTNRRKFGNRAVRAYARQGYQVYPVHPTASEIEGHRAYPSVLDIPEGKLDQVSIYLPREPALKVLEEVARRPPTELWLNPGADHPDVVARANQLGLNVVVACSILGVGEHPSSF